MLDLLQKLLWTILLSTFLLQPYRRYSFPTARGDGKMNSCYKQKNRHANRKWFQWPDSLTTSFFLLLLYLHRRAWSSRTISLEPTHRHCPLPACCSGWQCHCPCSSYIYMTNSHPHLHVISSADRRITMKKAVIFLYLDTLVCRQCLCKTKFKTIFIDFNVYHDQNSMSEGTSGLKCLLVVVILIFPLHTLLYDRVGFWVFTFPVQEEQSWCHVLYSCRCVRNTHSLHFYHRDVYNTIQYINTEKENTQSVHGCFQLLDQ